MKIPYTVKIEEKLKKKLKSKLNAVDLTARKFMPFIIEEALNSLTKEKADEIKRAK